MAATAEAAAQEPPLGRPLAHRRGPRVGGRASRATVACPAGSIAADGLARPTRRAGRKWTSASCPVGAKTSVRGALLVCTRYAPVRTSRPMATTRPVGRHTCHGRGAVGRRVEVMPRSPRSSARSRTRPPAPSRIAALSTAVGRAAVLEDNHRGSVTCAPIAGGRRIARRGGERLRLLERRRARRGRRAARTRGTARGGPPAQTTVALPAPSIPTCGEVGVVVRVGLSFDRRAEWLPPGSAARVPRPRRWPPRGGSRPRPSCRPARPRRRSYGSCRPPAVSLNGRQPRRRRLGGSGEAGGNAGRAAAMERHASALRRASSCPAAGRGRARQAACGASSLYFTTLPM